MGIGGVFKRGQRGRLWLSLSICYLLLFNALLSAGVGARWEIAQADPLLQAVLASLCRPEGGEPRPGQAPGHHQLDCALCGHACPMGGCAPTAFDRSVDLRLVRVATDAPAFDLQAMLPSGSRRLYPSDSLSQGPPPSALRA
jgi:hypothetical protein